MLSSVLRSPRAVAVNVEIMRAFVELRRVIESNVGLARKLDALERKYDGQFKTVFEAIRQLMTPSPNARERVRTGAAQSIHVIGDVYRNPYFLYMKSRLF